MGVVNNRYNEFCPTRCNSILCSVVRATKIYCSRVKDGTYRWYLVDPPSGEVSMSPWTRVPITVSYSVFRVVRDLTE